MALPWPASLKPSNVSWSLQNMSRSGGASMTGAEQVVSSDAGRWKASISIELAGQFREDKVLAFRALMAGLQGRVGEILVPVFDGYRPRDNQGRMLSDKEVAGFAEGFVFDHSGFGQDDISFAVTTSAAALGATQISLNFTGTTGPRPGHYFSIGDRLYLAHAVWQNTAGGVTYVQFAPRLRAAAPTGTAVIIDKPRCLMRLASDDTGELTLRLRRFGSVSLDFTEAL